MPEPRVSVIVPVYNGADLLGATLQSALAQDGIATEVVVVDDGSTDESATVAEGYAGVRVVRQANAGPSAARNRGLAETTAPYVAFLDADDLWPAGRLARLAGVLDADDRLGAALGQLQMVVEEEGEMRPVMPPQFGFQFGSALIRRTAFEAVGLVDEALRFSEDMDWFMRAREAGVPIARVPEVLYLYRQHADSLTEASDSDDFGIAAVLKRSLDRRRQAGSIDLPPLPEAS